MRNYINEFLEKTTLKLENTQYKFDKLKQEKILQSYIIKREEDLEIITLMLKQAENKLNTMKCVDIGYECMIGRINVLKDVLNILN